MPLTKEQLAERHLAIGASDIPTIMGFNPYMNIYDLWLYKTGRIEPSDEMSDAAKLGVELEPFVLKQASKELGKIKSKELGPDRTMQAITFRAEIEGVLFVVHPDGIALERNGNPVEAKTSGLINPTLEQWGDSGSDCIPDRVILQSHGQMKAMNKDVCHVAALLTGMKFNLYEVPFSQTLWDIIIENCYNFMHNHVKADIPPENAIPSIDVVKRIRRQPNKTVDIAQTLIDAYIKAQQAESAAKKAKDQAQAAILAVMDDAEGAVSDKGQRVTYFEQMRKGYVVDDSAYRVMRFPKK